MTPTNLARYLLSAIERRSGKQAPWSAKPTGDGKVEIAIWNTTGPAAASKRFDFRAGLTESLIGSVCDWVLPMMA
jgi:hypothetical protein